MFRKLLLNLAARKHHALTTLRETKVRPFRFRYNNLIFFCQRPKAMH